MSNYTYDYRVGQEKPIWLISWYDGLDRLKDLTAYSSFTVKFFAQSAPNTIVSTKTTGFTTYGTGDSLFDDYGVNLTVAPTATEWNSFNPAAAGTIYIAELVGITGGEDDPFPGTIRVRVRPAAT